ncbi:hypothetical protein BKA69DRAFT_62166 [Paraphysoderma sedebokerense]|nr:hypothetical protein BKA69DRAFT_62166 [Paraphysoderma sedebokerense]
MSVDTTGADFKLHPTNSSAKITGVHESLLQECEKDIIWYRDHFFGKPHTNFLTTSSSRGPVAVSVIEDGVTYKALVRTTEGSDRLSIPCSSVPIPWYRKVLGWGPTPMTLLKSISPSLPVNVLKVCKDGNLPNELLAMEERQVIRSYKFGLCYLRSGQRTEEEMFSNKEADTSPEFREFLNFIGETIELRNWKGYRAGLDVANGQTGSKSVYTKWQGYEIMFHVSTYLPHVAGDKQQIEKKRHIGNDIVLIIFQDSDTPFALNTLTSKQNHVIAFVKPEGDGYRIQVVDKKGVPSFTPELPEPPIFKKDAVGRDFFLHKLVNGERASYKSPSFAPKISRTRTVLLYDIAERFLG